MSQYPKTLNLGRSFAFIPLWSCCEFVGKAQQGGPANVEWGQLLLAVVDETPSPVCSSPIMPNTSPALTFPQGRTW